MLKVLSDPYIREGRAIGQVLEFCGDGVVAMNMDERATLTNMAVEAGATTGIIAADHVTVEYLQNQNRWDERLRPMVELRPDPDATYVHEFSLDLSELRPMVATPGDPRNGIFLDQLEVIRGGKPVRIDIAYGGSCTGGKMTDMDISCLL